MFYPPGKNTEKPQSGVVSPLYARGIKDIQNSRQNQSKNKLFRKNTVTRAHGICSHQVMGTWPKQWTNPFIKMPILQLSNVQCFCNLGEQFFYQECCQPFFPTIWPKKVKVKKLQIFLQNHGLTPVEKCKFSNFVMWMFSYSKKAIFLQECPQTSLTNSAETTQTKKVSIFSPKPGTNPSKKCKFCNFLITIFCSLKKLFCIKKITKQSF